MSFNWKSIGAGIVTAAIIAMPTSSYTAGAKVATLETKVETTSKVVETKLVPREEHEAHWATEAEFRQEVRQRLSDMDKDMKELLRRAR